MYLDKVIHLHVYVIRVKGSAFSHTLYIVHVSTCTVHHVITVINCALLFLIKVSVQVSPDDTDIGRWERLSGNFAALFPRSLSSVSLSSSVHTEKEAKKRKAQPMGQYMYLCTCVIYVLFVTPVHTFCLDMAIHMYNVHFNNCFSWIK